MLRRHSLGGALATLCAYDIKQRCPCAAYAVNVHVYTFGVRAWGLGPFSRSCTNWEYPLPAASAIAHAFAALADGWQL